MEASFKATQERAREEGEGASATSEEEIETLVGKAIRRSRRNVTWSSFAGHNPLATYLLWFIVNVPFPLELIGSFVS